MKKMNNRKGFTLAELLIVVAIIAVLVAIAIPVFTSQLEKAREATDVANVRSGYGAAVSEYLGKATPTEVTVTVPATQTITGWQSSSDAEKKMYLSTDIGSFAKKVEITNHIAPTNFTIKITTAGVVTVE
jgi:type IV pilus assembly protein PilA